MEKQQRRLKKRPASGEVPICPNCRVPLEDENDEQGRLMKTECPECGFVAVERLAGGVPQ